MPVIRKASDNDMMSGRRSINIRKVDPAYYDTMVGSEHNG